MFNNITKTCSGADATWEILTMLTGAFLLGCLLCWLIKKLRGLNKSGLDNPPTNSGRHGYDDTRHITNNATNNVTNNATKNNRNGYNDTAKGNNAETSSLYSSNGANNSSRDTTSYQAHQSYKARKVEEQKQTSSSPYANPKIDDLKRISSVNEEIASLLRDKGIKSYTDLRDIDHTTLSDVMHSPNFNIPKQEVETWPHQSSLAAKGEWKKLTDYQNFRNRSQNAVDNAGASSASASTNTQQTYTTNKTEAGEIKNTENNNFSSDNFSKIEGITPKIAQTLNERGITNFSQLSASNNDTLKSHLLSANINQDKVDTESWLQQAALAEEGKWDDLEEYQDFLSIRNKNTTPQSTSSDDIQIASGTAHPTSTASDNNNKNPVSKINETDDLTKIEGIGPKISEVLNGHNINTFEALHKTTRNTLKKHLDNEGPQYKMHEPESWPHQAGMAYRGEWEKLKEYQDFMMGGRDDIASLSKSSLSKSSKLSSADISDTQKQTANRYASDKKQASLSTSYVDDLTKIEGIGPKIEQLLNEAGILNFAQVKSSDRDTIKSILDTGGPQFKMHEPESWPKQAEYADDAEWEKLEKYQDELVGGR